MCAPGPGVGVDVGGRGLPSRRAQRRPSSARPAGRASPRTPLVDALLAEWRANAERWEAVAERARAAGLGAWNPGLYAAPLHERFLRAHPPRRGALLALGLNPGPAGMAQTGVPFTDVRTLRDRLGIPLEMPGLAPADLARFLRKPGDPTRWRLTYERSSLVVYAFLRHAWGDERAAYAEWFVGNPCPLLFLDEDGGNVTPADPRLRKIPGMQEMRVEAVERFAAVLRPRGVVCLGNDVAACVGETAERLVGAENVVRFKHPARESPATWGVELAADLRRRGLLTA